MTRQPCGDKCQDIALIAAYIHYFNKLNNISSNSEKASENTNAWKEFGRKKSVLRF